MIAFLRYTPTITGACTTILNGALTEIKPSPDITISNLPVSLIWNSVFTKRGSSSLGLYGGARRVYLFSSNNLSAFSSLVLWIERLFEKYNTTLLLPHLSPDRKSNLARPPIKRVCSGSN